MFLAQISLNLPRRKQPRNEIGLLVDNLEENHISMFIILDEYTPLLGVEFVGMLGKCGGMHWVETTRPILSNSV